MNREFTIQINVVVSAENADKLTKNPSAYTDAIFRVIARRIKDEGFATVRSSD